MALSKRALLVCGPVAMLACSFDSNGLQTSSNSAGTLESSGSETSAEGTEGPTTTSPTSNSTSTSATSTGPQTTAPSDESTTTPPTTTETATETGEDPATTDPGTSTDASVGESSSSEGGSSSTETGPTTNPYGPCDGSEDCDGAMCVDVYLDGWHQVCYPGCAETDDCPAPDGGNASPLCTPSGCGLDCEADTNGCPAGMECGYVNMGDDRRCVWP